MGLSKAPPGPDDVRPIEPLTPEQEAEQRRVAAERQAEEIASAVELGDWSELDEILESELEAAYADAYWAGLGAVAEAVGSADASADAVARFGVALDQVNPLSLAWAKAHAAEQVTGIRERTRDMMRDTITDAIEGGWSNDRLAGELRDSQGFGKARAEMIARTETQFASNYGNLEAFKDSGVATGKLWLTAGDDLVDEEICAPNEDEGPIPLDDAFPDGSDCPPGHPRCRCSLSVWTEPLE